ncbi:MAG: helix-turn-helix domain-containing protein, partial [Bacteroidota bacterium]
KLLTKSSLKTIGLHFGGRDHSTVIHSLSSIENLVAGEPKMKEMVDSLKNKIEMRVT